MVVEDEQLLRWGLRRQLEIHGHVVHEAPNLAQAEALLREQRPDVVLLDLRLPDGNGLDFMASNQAYLAESLVIITTASGQIEAAVRAMKLGAFDFLTKPVREAELLALIDQALERQQEKNAVERFRRERERSEPSGVIAHSDKMKAVLDMAETVATSAASTIHVHGETGTGKEVLARYIHARSPRAEGPLLAVNCAALPEQLVESELFGHEKGAFTDARFARKGIFELAHGGTVVLDEVVDLPLPLQAKLLRFLEERTFRRVGGSREILVDLRVLSLANVDLAAAAAEGKFRSDLFYRLNVFPIEIPPLRERRDDIVPLALHFVRQFGALCGKKFEGLSVDVEQRLLAHDWPGNVRELRNLMERAAILEPGGVLLGKSLTVGVSGAPAVVTAVPPAAATAATTPAPAEHDEFIPLEEMGYAMVRKAMKLASGNQSQAARLLGMSRDQVRYRIKKYREEGRWDDAWGGDEAET